jgi:hypothetical protein
VLCDYEHARPRMLPAHFADYAIQVGGQGVGTVIAYVLRVSRRRETRQAAFGARALTHADPGARDEAVLVELGEAVADGLSSLPGSAAQPIIAGSTSPARSSSARMAQSAS